MGSTHLLRLPMKTTVIDDVELVLAQPLDQNVTWIGQNDLKQQILASWLVVGEGDLPLCPRLVGKPGVGKTTLACAAGRDAELPVYVQQCTADTRPEDLLVTPVLSQAGQIAYHASPLVSAMLAGGLAILDEANRMSEKSWASLAPLLDHRRYVESVVAGIRIPAEPRFRACVTMNDDASTFEVPDYMLSRIQPSVEINFPEREEELRVLEYQLPFAPEQILALTVDFLQGGHQFGLPYSTRDGINIVRYALKLKQQRNQTIRSDRAWTELFEGSVKQILGPDALDLKKQSLQREEPSYMDLRDFFEALDEMGDSEDESDS